MAIDRADWHWETAEKEFREKNGITGELTRDQINQIWLLAANHIGLFIQWIIDRGFEGEDADPEDCGKVRARQMTGTEYLEHYAECCLDGEDKPCYGVITGEEDYARLKAKIDTAYEDFVTR